MDSSSPATQSDPLLQMLRTDPANASLLQECVRVALAEGRPDKAREALAVSRVDGVPASVLRYGSAQVLLHEHRWAEAVDVLSQLLDIDGQVLPPSDAAAALFAKGFALFNDGRYADASASLEQALLTGSAPNGSLSYLLRSLHHAGNPAAACEAWTRASASDRTPEAAGIASLAYLEAG